MPAGHDDNMSGHLAGLLRTMAADAGGGDVGAMALAIGLTSFVDALAQAGPEQAALIDPILAPLEEEAVVAVSGGGEAAPLLLSPDLVEAAVNGAEDIADRLAGWYDEAVDLLDAGHGEGPAHSLQALGDALRSIIAAEGPSPLGLRLYTSVFLMRQVTAEARHLPPMGARLH